MSLFDILLGPGTGMAQRAMEQRGMSLSDLLFGTPATQEQIQTLTPEQQQLFQQLISALSGQQTTGPFGGTIQHLAALAQGDPEALGQFTAPMERQFQEQTIPDLAARFAGMGSGGAFRGSGFRQAALREGTNLAERMQAMQGDVRMRAAGAMPGFFGMATAPQFQPAITQPTTGLIPGMAAGFAQGAGRAMTGGF